MSIHSSGTTLLVGVIACLVWFRSEQPGWSQVIGDEAEMERLRTKAEEAMGNDDPDGAALSMGRAALMAKNLTRKYREDNSAVQLFQGAEFLFRSQEHGYRAMALFRRGGGQLPASSGVCGSLALAHQSIQHAVTSLDQAVAQGSPSTKQAGQFRQTADDWSTVIDSMITDYQCP